MDGAAPGSPDARPLRVLLITRAPVGGLWRHILDLTDGLLERGFEVGVVVDSLRASDHVRATLERLGPRLALGVHLLEMPRLPGLGDVALTRACRRLVKRLRPDIVHGHSAKGGLYARLGAWGLPAKAIYTPHGGSLHYDWSTLSGRIFLTGERLLMPLCDRFLFESRYSQQGYATKIGTADDRAHVIYNGLGGEEFAGGVQLMDAPAYDFAFAGEMRAIKGVDLLLEALARISHPDGRPVRALLLGDGPALDTYKALAAELRLSDRVVFAGRRPVREAFEATNTIVVPSRAESLPYIVMESVAAGKRVVATDVGGIGEIFGPTREALVPPDDPAALAAALEAALQPAEAGEMAVLEARYAHVAAHFHVDMMVDQIADSYRDLARR